jgi:tetrahydromethanopterin S-methyltransferase subunit A
VSGTSAARPAVRIGDEMREAAAARKCWACGCFHDALAQLSDALPTLPAPDRERLTPILAEGAARVAPQKYECLGCETCWPANALNAAAEAYPDTVAGGACPTDGPARGQAWPPLPGNYRVLDAGGRIAVCVLTSEPLLDALAAARPTGVAIVGTLHTENLGIERVIRNVLANPNLATLFVCGADSRQRVGHLPGQSLLSLVTRGVDEQGRIRDAEGRRPVLRNLPPETVEAFRREVAVVDRRGEERAEALLEMLAAAPSPNGSRPAPVPEKTDPVPAEPPPRLVLDPMGWFVLFPDRVRERILVEHYTNDGTLAHAFTGRTAHELYTTIIARNLVSRFDHAAYLGTELARAERSLATGEPYVQDRAPEPRQSGGCGCRPAS